MSALFIATDHDRPAAEEVATLVRRGLLREMDVWHTWGPHAEWLHDGADHCLIELQTESSVLRERFAYTYWDTSDRASRRSLKSALDGFRTLGGWGDDREVEWSAVILAGVPVGLADVAAAAVERWEDYEFLTLRDRFALWRLGRSL